MASIWDAVVGQPRAVERLARAAAQPVHAYLFVGPSGSTKTQAARAFAALLIGGVDEPEARDARLALAGMHPDIREIERAGPAISAEQAREIVRLSSLAPIESDRKVLILAEFHLLRPEGAALLLKTIEEPPPSTIFLILADFVPADLVTISSRCAADRVPLDRRRRDHRTTCARGGQPRRLPPTRRARPPATSQRARLLAADPDLVERRRAFASVPSRLDGNGATVMRLVDELLGLIDSAAGSAVRSPRRRGGRGSTRGSSGSVSAAAARRRSTSGTSASCAGTAPTSSATGCRCSPVPTATHSSPARSTVPAVSPPPSCTSTRRSRRSSATPTSSSSSNPSCGPSPSCLPETQRRAVWRRQIRGPCRTVCLKRSDAPSQADRTGRSGVRWHR